MKKQLFLAIGALLVFVVLGTLGSFLTLKQWVYRPRPTMPPGWERISTFEDRFSSRFTSKLFLGEAMFLDNYLDLKSIKRDGERVTYRMAVFMNIDRLGKDSKLYQDYPTLAFMGGDVLINCRTRTTQTLENLLLDRKMNIIKREKPKYAEEEPVPDHNPKSPIAQTAIFEKLCAADKNQQVPSP